MPSKKLQKKLVEDTGLSVIIAALLMMVAAPFYVYAITDGSTSGVLDLSGISQSLNGIKDDVGAMRSRLDVLNGKLDAVSSRLETIYMADADPVATSPGVAECLDACRKTTSSCFTPTKAATTTVATTSIIAPSGAVNQAACQARIDTCARNCRPVTNTLSCDTTCAVQLGACVRGAGGDRVLAAACRKSNEACLVSLCRSAGTARPAIQSATLPADTCHSQCLRAFTICRQANRLNSSDLLDCTQNKQDCEDLVCSGQAATTGSGVPRPMAQNIVCENDCTRSFLACRTQAGDNIQVMELCNSGYGNCRNQCLITSGGGFGQGTSTRIMEVPPILVPPASTNATPTPATAPPATYPQ